jgi:cell division protein FtsW (lipid II flippase)
MKEKIMTKTQNTPNSNLFLSVRRTVVPMIMGWVATLPVSQFVDVDAVETALVAVFASIYYVVLRKLEDRGVPAASWWIAFGRTPAPRYEEES